MMNPDFRPTLRPGFRPEPRSARTTPAPYRAYPFMGNTNSRQGTHPHHPMTGNRTGHRADMRPPVPRPRFNTPPRMPMQAQDNNAAMPPPDRAAMQARYKKMQQQRQAEMQARMAAMKARQRQNDARIKAELERQAQHLARMREMQQRAFQQNETERRITLQKIREMNQQFHRLQNQVEQLLQGDQPAETPAETPAQADTTETENQ